MQLRLLMFAMSLLQGRLLMPGVLCLLVASITWVALAEPERQPPIIDMHLHPAVVVGQQDAQVRTCDALEACAPAATEAALRRRTQTQLQRYNVIRVASVRPDGQRAQDPGTHVPGHLALDPLKIDAATVARVRALRADGQLTVLGVRTASPLALDDPRMEPLWQLATGLDLPVGLRMGRQRDITTPAATELDALRRVLARHPRLRVDLVHGAEPVADELLAVLDAHPQVYLDVGQLVSGQDRPAFYRDLQAIVDAGLADRVMFGSGSPAWPASIGASIETVRRAPFLDDGQKRDIFYNNAARFLRLERQQPAASQRTI